MSEGGSAFERLTLRLETARLVLAPWTVSDADVYADLIAERGPGARGHGTTPEQARDKIVGLAADERRDGIGFRAITRRTEGDVIGYCGLLVGRGSLAEPEVAYELLRRAHGHGYATEATAELVAAAAATGRRRLWSTVAEWNVASLRVLDKLGFEVDRVQVETSGGSTVYLTRGLANSTPLNV